MVIDKTAIDCNKDWQTAYKNVVTAVGHRYKKYGLREDGVEKGEGARRTHEIPGIVVANHHGQQNWQLRRSTARWKSCGPKQRAAYWANAAKGKKRFPISRVGVMPEGEFA